MTDNAAAEHPASPMCDEASAFLDVPMRVMIRLSEKKMKVREILNLKPSSIVELPKSAGENVDVLINGRLAAYGEVIELEGSAGIRLTSLIAES